MEKKLVSVCNIGTQGRLFLEEKNTNFLSTFPMISEKILCKISLKNKNPYVIINAFAETLPHRWAIPTAIGIPIAVTAPLEKNADNAIKGTNNRNIPIKLDGVPIKPKTTLSKT